MRKEPTVIKEMLNKLSRKLLKVKYQILPQEAWLNKVSIIHNYIKAQGYKVIAHISRESLPSKQNKLMPTKRERVFMGYNKHITSHYKLYISNIYIIIISNNIKFFKNIPDNSINNYQL